MIATINQTDTRFVDDGTTLNGDLDESATSKLRPRFDARLAIDPAVVLKLDGAHIHAEVGAQIIAEGRDGHEVVITSILDDRYGAGSTFDASNDGAPIPGGVNEPTPGSGAVSTRLQKVPYPLITQLSLMVAVSLRLKVRLLPSMLSKSNRRKLVLPIVSLNSMLVVLEDRLRLPVMVAESMKRVSSLCVTPSPSLLVILSETISMMIRRLVFPRSALMPIR